MKSPRQAEHQLSRLGDLRAEEVRRKRELAVVSRGGEIPGHDEQAMSVVLAEVKLVNRVGKVTAGAHVVRPVTCEGPCLTGLAGRGASDSCLALDTGCAHDLAVFSRLSSSRPRSPYGEYGSVGRSGRARENAAISHARSVSRAKHESDDPGVREEFPGEMNVGNLDDQAGVERHVALLL